MHENTSLWKFADDGTLSETVYKAGTTRDVARGGAEGAAAPPLLLKERFSKEDDTMPKTR